MAESSQPSSPLEAVLRWWDLSKPYPRSHPLPRGRLHPMAGWWVRSKGYKDIPTEPLQLQNAPEDLLRPLLRLSYGLTSPSTQLYSCTLHRCCSEEIPPGNSLQENLRISEYASGETQLKINSCFKRQRGTGLFLGFLSYGMLSLAPEPLHMLIPLHQSVFCHMLQTWHQGSPWSSLV